MAKYCADCTYFDPKDKKAEGLCKCSKEKKYMLGNNPKCEKFNEAYSRNWYEKEKLYDDGKATMNKTNTTINVGSYFILAVILIIIAIIANIFM